MTKTLSIILILAILPILFLVQNIEGDWRIVAACTFIPSLISYLLIGRDKNQAIRGQQRTPESALHFFELIGGWPGSYLAQQRFRHKTIKESYRTTFWLIVILHQALALDGLLGWPTVKTLVGFLRSLG